MSEAVSREQRLAAAGGVPDIVRRLLAQPVGEALDSLVAENPSACETVLLGAAFEWLTEGSTILLAPHKEDAEAFLQKFTCLKTPNALRAEISAWAPGPMSAEVFICFV